MTARPRSADTPAIGHQAGVDAPVTGELVLHIVSDLRHHVREIENAWVPLPGTDERMAARIFLPEDAGPDNRVPVILEYLPYRKRDFTALRDTPMHT